MEEEYFTEIEERPTTRFSYKSKTEMSKQTRNILILVGVLVVIFGIGLILSIVYPMKKDKPWVLKYHDGNKWVDVTIHKPFYEIVRPDGGPADKTFSIVWPILFALLSYAIATVITSEDWKREDVVFSLILIAIQMCLVFSWIPVFSHHHEPRKAMYILVVCVMLGLFTSVFLKNKNAGSIWALYTGWLIYALMLNLQSVAKYDALVRMVKLSGGGHSGPGPVTPSGPGPVMPPSGPGPVMPPVPAPSGQPQQIPLPMSE